VSVAIAIVFFIESLGRKKSLFISAMGLGTTYFIVGAILKTHPVQTISGYSGTPSSASKAMAAMLYISACFFAVGVGPVPWIYVSDIFPTRTRHYGLAIASASHWLFSACPIISEKNYCPHILNRLQRDETYAHLGCQSWLQVFLHVCSYRHWWNNNILHVSW